MAIVLENNRHFVGSDITTTTGVPGPEGLGVLARVFIDLGIAVVAIGGAAFTAGASVSLLGVEVAVPSLVGLAGSGTALITNTSIDVGEGNTDALTLGLDIGLPFATEGLGVLAAAAFRTVTLPEKLFDFYTRNVTLDLEAFTGQRRTINNAIKNVRDQAYTVKRISQEELSKFTPDQIWARARMIDAERTVNKQADELATGFKSLTDIFDKLTGVARDFVAKLLPRLTKFIKEIKVWANKFKKAISVVLNPVNFALTKAKTETKAILKNIKFKETDIKMRMQTIKQRYNIRKQSLLQNALISKYNIQRVDSSWVLGTSLVINDAADDGTIKDAHLIWWFIPEATAHDGSRGAIPEPYGKRPVAMLNINQAQYDMIMAEASKGTFYLDNVANGKSSSSLFGGASGINVSDLKSNFISKLFKNSLSIIPGYSLFVDVKHSIKELQTITDKIVSGELGKDYFRQLTNYKSHLHSAGSLLLPKQFNEAANVIYHNQKFLGLNVLKSVDSKAQSKMNNITKSGTIIKVKNM